VAHAEVEESESVLAVESTIEDSTEFTLIELSGVLVQASETPIESDTFASILGFPWTQNSAASPGESPNKKSTTLGGSKSFILGWDTPSPRETALTQMGAQPLTTRFPSNRFAFGCERNRIFGRSEATLFDEDRCFPTQFPRADTSSIKEEGSTGGFGFAIALPPTTKLAPRPTQSSPVTTESPVVIAGSKSGVITLTPPLYGVPPSARTSFAPQIVDPINAPTIFHETLMSGSKSIVFTPFPPTVITASPQRTISIEVGPPRTESKAKTSGAGDGQ
jgi:hypothetical protein